MYKVIFEKATPSTPSTYQIFKTKQSALEFAQGKAIKMYDVYVYNQKGKMIIRYWFDEFQNQLQYLEF